MAIFETYYDTTVGAKEKALVHNADHQILVASVRQPIYVDKPTGASYIAGQEFSAVPQFFHPLTIEKETRHGKQKLVVLDARNYVTIERDLSQKIRETDEFNFQCVRTVLTNAWVTDRQNIMGYGPSALRDISGVSMTVYAQMISETLAAKLTLDIDTQHRIYILAGIFYNSLFLEDAPNEMQTDRLAVSLSASLTADIRVVREMLAMTNYIVDITAFANFAKEIDPVRLNAFTKATVMTSLNGQWYGTDANQTMASALEHPPTFMAMLFAGGESRGFKSTRLMRLLERNTAKREYPVFQQRLKRFVQMQAERNNTPFIDY